MIQIDNFLALQNAQEVMQKVLELQEALSTKFYDTELSTLGEELEKVYENLFDSTESFLKKQINKK